MILPSLLISIFLAANIGANNSAAEMSAAYGAGARSKREALLLIAIFVCLGAVLNGQEVIRTVGMKLVNQDAFSSHAYIPFVVMAITSLTIFIANRASVPIATAHASVCAMAAAGIIFKGLNWEKLYIILLWWMVTPLVSCFLNYFLGKYVYFFLLSKLSELSSEARIEKLLKLLLTLSGCFIAFTAGGNSSAKAAGPLVALNMVTPWQGSLLAGISMSLGALLMGGRVLVKTGKGITELCALRASLVEFSAATIVFIANQAGIPISLAETVTGALIGLSLAQKDNQTLEQKKHVKRILTFWLLSPISVFFFTLGIFKIIILV